MNPYLSQEDQRIRAIVAPPAACPGCVAETGGIIPPGVTTQHCPRHLAAVRATLPVGEGVRFAFHGSHRFALAERARALCVAQLGEPGYYAHLRACIGADHAAAVRTALERVAVVMAGEVWVIALCILYELKALPDPLVVTLGPGMTAIPLPEIPPVQEVRYGR